MNHNTPILDLAKVYLINFLAFVFTTSDTEIFLKNGVLFMTLIYTGIKIYKEAVKGNNNEQ